MTATSDIDRDALIASTLRYVGHLAAEARHNLPRGVALDDLVSAGREGLVEAAQRYDPTRGVQFATFAHYRIRGAIMDHVRDASMGDPVYRARAAAESAVDDLLERRLGDLTTSSADDAASVLAVALQEMAAAFTLSEIAAHTAAEKTPDPEAAVVEIERARHLDDVVDALPERERLMLRAVYYEGQSIEQAGKGQGLSKSWASRLHARAVTLLREQLAPLEEAL